MGVSTLGHFLKPFESVPKHKSKIIKKEFYIMRKKIR